MAGLNDNTKLLLNCDGADTSTDFDDQSNSNHTVTAVANAQVDVDQSKWGGASLLLDGTDDTLTIPDSADWDVIGSNTDSWTIDLWVKHADHAGEEVYIGQAEDATNRWRLFHSDSNGLSFTSAGPGELDTGYAGEITDTNWHHIAMCKVGADYGVYKDGQIVCHTNDSSTDTLAAGITIGSNGLAPEGSWFQGHLEEIRVQHSNYFGASPDAGLTDTIPVPTGPYTDGGKGQPMMFSGGVAVG